MKFANEAGWDRIARVIVGLVLLSLYLFNVVSGAVGIAVLVASAVMLLTGLVGYCPMYTLFKFRTNKPEKKAARA
jgi:uncharacterized membrane protein YuzA (DUF378 family)